MAAAIRQKGGLPFPEANKAGLTRHERFLLNYIRTAGPERDLYQPSQGEVEVFGRVD